MKSPVTIEKTYKYGGETRSKRVLVAAEKSPISVSELAQNIHNYFWYRRTVSEGTQGPITYEFTKRRVVLSNGGLLQKTVWLIIKRTLGESPKYSFYISNAPASTRLKTFVWLSGLRWAIEQCFEETKTELGMDQYEVRKFMGWHHHIMVCILAHFFLWHLKIRLGEKAPSITLSQLRVLLEAVLPLRHKDVEIAVEIVKWVQARKHRAYLSDRKRKLKKLSLQSEVAL